MVKGELCIITGANSGVGRCLAFGLAELGARVVLACRSAEKAEAACKDITSSTGNTDVTYMPLDLTSLASVRGFAGQLDDAPVSVLINNAGVMMGAREETADGYEVTFQTNALAPLLLASLLKPNLARAARDKGGAPGSARVVYVSSRAVPDPKERFQAREGFATFPVYGTSKLGGTALTYELARRWAEEGLQGVCVNACTPGMVHTQLGRFAPAWARYLSWPLRYMLLRPAAKGAETPLWLASSGAEAAVSSGLYFSDMQAIASSEASYDVTAAARLWETCEAMAGEKLG